ncbi:MAG: 1,4-alpha-glucan branching protein [Candidatus Microsaccharimonas sossegonensis]|uniref:1,4-alpha-glucan branching enzyme n=1 Tax=Candidatus Microsaccharimonas sossegonensis TaxID=2506948 RepID=A0A4V1J7C1_9BACT|nr:MAG: 1,4-alpha-glucan branching protein [Candidatus Microsaccharimonas sossegonensis]
MGHQTTHFLGSRVTGNNVDFRVWAPFAQSVHVLILNDFNWHETPLTSEENGYWSGTVKDAQPGKSYKYRLTTQDGKTIDRNDPRSRQLTVSDNGDSVIIDPEYDWEDTVSPIIPKEKRIIYELHIGTFHRPDAATSGTFYTAIEKLDYLQSLGINTIELMPVTSMATSNGWGYAPNHIFSVENSYGGRRGLLDFVKACHQRSISVILDVVYNHFSNQTELWQYDGWSENNRGGIYFYNDWRGDTPWGERPDYGRPEVRQFILDNVTMWLTEYHIDGLRIDSTIYMRNGKGSDGGKDTEIPDAWSLLQDIAKLAHKIDPNALMIAEDNSGNDYITKPISEGGAGYDAQWGLGFPYAIRSMLRIGGAHRTDSLTKQLLHRYNGQSFQKVIFSDSHDTAANGSVRINEAATPGNAESVFARQFVLLANAVTLTAPGIPMLLQGEEFMQEGNFNDWQMLEWAKTKQFAGIVLAHQHLIGLRLNIYGNTTGLTGPSINVFHQDNENRVLAYHRWLNGGVHDDVIVIANCSDQRFKSYEIILPLPGTWRARFNSSWKGYSPDFNETHTSIITTDAHNRLIIELADYNFVILSQD